VDITYIPMARLRLSGCRRWLVQPQGPGVEAVDHAGGRLSRIEALEEALARHGRPEIFNTDQGSQFTSAEFIKVLKNAETAIGMDGKGAQAATTSLSSGSGGQ
jgi:putative transposase